MHKSESSEIEPCNLPEDWGWDSLTCRLSVGDAPPFEGSWIPRLTIDSVLGPGAGWLSFRGVQSIFADSLLSSEGFEVPKRLFVTTKWSQTFGTAVRDAAGQCRIRLVDPWPEPRRGPIQTTRLVGHVVDDSTGCGIAWCRLTINGTKLGALTDTSGKFEIVDVPVMKMHLNACAIGYAWKHVDLHPRSHDLVLRLLRQPGARLGQRPCR